MTYNGPDNMLNTTDNRKKNNLNVELKFSDKKCILKWFVN